MELNLPLGEGWFSLPATLESPRVKPPAEGYLHIVWLWNIQDLLGGIDKRASLLPSHVRRLKFWLFVARELVSPRKKKFKRPSRGKKILKILPLLKKKFQALF